MGQKFKNINGTSDRASKCKCGSWIKHWENYSGGTRGKCAVSGCSNNDEHGAHVQKVEGTDTWHIANFCAIHNVGYKNTVLELKEGAKLALANRGVTCGY